MTEENSGSERRCGIALPLPCLTIMHYLHVNYMTLLVSARLSYSTYRSAVPDAE